MPSRVIRYSVSLSAGVHAPVRGPRFFFGLGGLMIETGRKPGVVFGVEMAGMIDHCDFFEQETTDGEEGRLRPDLLVRLPGGKTIIVDAKAPLEAYLDAAEASTDDARAEALARHAKHVRRHVETLASRVARELIAVIGG